MNEKLIIYVGLRFLLEDVDSMYKGYYDEYILCLVKSSTNEINLINLKNGMPFNNPISVKDVHNITHEDFKKLTKEHKFILIRR